MTGVHEPDGADLTVAAATSMLAPTVSHAGEPVSVQALSPRVRSGRSSLRGPADRAVTSRPLPGGSAASRSALPQVASFAAGLVAGGLLTRRLFGDR